MLCQTEPWFSIPLNLQIRVQFVVGYPSPQRSWWRCIWPGPQTSGPANGRQKCRPGKSSCRHFNLFPVRSAILVYHVCTSLGTENFFSIQKLTRSSPHWWSGRSTTPHDVLNLWSPSYDASVWGYVGSRWAQSVACPCIPISSVLTHMVYF